MNTQSPQADGARSSLVQSGPTAVVIPYVTISQTAADFRNSRNEVQQLNSWISQLPEEEVVSLLQKVFDYNRGSLYRVLCDWCTGVELLPIPIGTVHTPDPADQLAGKSEPQDRGEAMWRFLQRRAVEHKVNLRRVLHFLLFVYSNDRLTTSDTGESTGNGGTHPGAPGRLAMSMCLALTQTPGSHMISMLSRVAPGFHEYMKGPLQSMREALAFPPFDGDSEIEDLFAEMFKKRFFNRSDAKRKRGIWRLLGDDLEEAPEKEDSAGSQFECVVCMSGTRKVVFMPCSHFVTCQLCSQSLDTCPVCRLPLMGKLEVFF